MRSELIKICKKKYAEITTYIRTKLGIESVLRTENTQKPPETPRPDMNAFKTEIISEIKNKFDSRKNINANFLVIYYMQLYPDFGFSCMQYITSNPLYTFLCE